jgi:hypothetical protein
VTVGWGLGRSITANQTTSACTILDHNGLTQCGFHFFGCKASQKVTGAARWKRHNEFDWP